MPPRAKRHHQVPRGYLNRFGADEVVRVRWRNGRLIETNTLNVAVESGFYDVPDATGGKSSDVEAALAGVDDTAVATMAEIDRSGRAPSVRSDDRFTLAVFMATRLGPILAARRPRVLAGAQVALSRSLCPMR